MAKSTPKFANFREAYCAYYRCRTEDFQKSVLLRAIHPLKLPFALPIYAFNKPFFAMDFMVIESMGDARTETEYEFAMDELIGINRVERSIRRGLLGIRVSGSRLSGLWKRLSPYVEVPVVETTAATAVVPQDTIGRRASSSAGVHHDVAPQAVRKLKVATDAITSGVPVAQAAQRAEFASEADFMETLAARAASSPSARWLLTQIEQSARVKALEADLARMKSLLGEKQLDLARSAEGLPRGGER